jgi:hypothetical protein
MKVKYRTPNGRIEFELEATTGKQAFEIVAAIQELFEEPDCGLCKSKAIRCEVRHHDNNSYYKMLCLECGGVIDFGQRKDGKSLFIKRVSEDKKPLPNRGWYKWEHGSRRS